MIKHHLKTGRIVTADEWLQWRKNGLSATEITQELGITPSMVRVIARKFTAAGFIDPGRHRTKPGPVKYIDTATDIGGYLLGVLWGTMAIGENDGYWIRHRDPWFVELIRDSLNISCDGHESYSHTGSQTRLKISRKTDIDVLFHYAINSQPLHR